ncbi:MAG: FMN-binding protein [Candidatus Coatesbacteria bacterium]|nr:FMN-binding protein [Candidatus Coatesbacteria bacterium]
MAKARFFITGFLLLIVVAGLVLIPAVLPSFEEIEQVQSLDVFDLDLTAVTDGVHAGSFSYGTGEYPVAVAVEVTVSDGRITDIIVTENEDREHPQSAEAVLPRIVDAQSLDVEAVSGATTTSKALMKAVENALLTAGATVDN